MKVADSMRFYIAWEHLPSWASASNPSPHPTGPRVHGSSFTIRKAPNYVGIFTEVSLADPEGEFWGRFFKFWILHAVIAWLGMTTDGTTGIVW